MCLVVNYFAILMINHKSEFWLSSTGIRTVQKNMCIDFSLNSSDAQVGHSCCLFSCDLIIVYLANKLKVISDQWPENA